MSNDFLPFAIGASANVESQSTYSTDAQLTNGQTFGSTGSSSLNNKALRQGTFVASQIAQFIVNQTGTSASDNGSTAQFIAQLAATFQYLPPVINTYTSSSGNWNAPYVFFIVAVGGSSSITSGATFTDSASHTFTVVTTVGTSATIVTMTGPNAPASSGSLNYASGSGYSGTITYYATRAPLYLEVDVVGDGGGGGAATTNNGSSGSGTTFGGTLLEAGGGSYGSFANNGGGAGGSPTVNSPAIAIISLHGGSGGSGAGATAYAPGYGASGPFGGGGGNILQAAGSAGAVNSGSGGGGGLGAGPTSGAAGGAGAYIKALIASPLSTYAYSIGGGGNGGAAGTSAGGNGGSGMVVVRACYQ